MHTFETYVRMQNGMLVRAQVQAPDWYSAMLLFKAMYGEENVNAAISQVSE